MADSKVTISVRQKSNVTIKKVGQSNVTISRPSQSVVKVANKGLKGDKGDTPTQTEVVQILNDITTPEITDFITAIDAGLNP